jgi:hypothetical protein
MTGPSNLHEIPTAGCASGSHVQQAFVVRIRRCFAVMMRVNKSLLVPFRASACYSLFVQHCINLRRDLIMEWTTPQHEEIDLNCEVSSYANAEL